MCSYQPEGVDVSQTKQLLIAAALHQTARVRYFIEQLGLCPNSTYGGKPTALCYVVLKPNHTIMRYLLESGADTSAQDALGMTPLHYAVLGGCQYCVTSLINAGAALNTPARSGKTPLDCALDRLALQPIAHYLVRVGGLANVPASTRQLDALAMH